MNITARRKARRLALQALYQWQLSQQPIAEIQAQFHTHQNMKVIDVDYFDELLQQISAQQEQIDQQFSQFLDRAMSALNPVELSILRIACYELLHRLDVPYRVVINEALELAKLFGAVEGHKYVNAVLDKLAKQSRDAEYQ